MAEIPTPALVSLVALRIFAVFDVSEVEARVLATGLVMHAEGWGGVDLPPIDWDEEVKKRFGDRLKWRSDDTRQRFIQEKKMTITAYESYIRARR